MDGVRVTVTVDELPVEPRRPLVVLSVELTVVEELNSLEARVVVVTVSVEPSEGGGVVNTVPTTDGGGTNVVV